MNQDQQNRQLENNDEQPYTFSDERTKKKIKLHLGDIHDVITEKDIENVKIPGNEKPASTASEKKEKKGSGKKTKKDKTPLVDNIPGNPATPWDIIDK